MLFIHNGSVTFLDTKPSYLNLVGSINPKQRHRNHHKATSPRNYGINETMFPKTSHYRNQPSKLWVRVPSGETMALSLKGLGQGPDYVFFFIAMFSWESAQLIETGCAMFRYVRWVFLVDVTRGVEG